MAVKLNVMSFQWLSSSRHANQSVEARRRIMWTMLFWGIHSSFAQDNGASVTTEQGSENEVPAQVGDEYSYRLEWSFGSSLLFVEQPLWNRELQENEAQVMRIFGACLG